MAIVYIAVRLGHKRVKYPIAIASSRGNPQLLPVGEIPNYFALLAFVLELKEVSSYLVDKENSRKLSAGYSPSKKLSSWFEVSYWASEASPTLVVWRCRPFPIWYRHSMTRSVRYQPILHTLYYTLHTEHAYCLSYRFLNNVVITTVIEMVELIETLDRRLGKRSVERVRYVINNYYYTWSL